jgi:polygalacturonase
VATTADCIAVKSGFCPAGLAYNVSSTNVTIRAMACRTQSACIAVGSEMSGGVFGVTASDIDCLEAGQALNVKSTLGRGGAVEGVSFSNVRIGTVGTALVVSDSYHDQVREGEGSSC